MVGAHAARAEPIGPGRDVRAELKLELPKLPGGLPMLRTAIRGASVSATFKAAAIKTMAANAPTDPQTLQGFRGIAPFVTGTTVACDPECAADGMSTAAQEMKGGLSWELAVGG